MTRSPNIILFASTAFLLLVGGCGAQNSSNSMGALKISSSVFADSGDIPKNYTCDGKDVNPPLIIDGVPDGAKSLALIVDDPDAPLGDFTHWTLWNIAPDTREIKEDSAPPGAIEGMTDFAATGWGGPCPPSGVHRYYFKLYALDTALDLPASTRKKELEAAMRGHIFESAATIGLYKRART